MSDLAGKTITIALDTMGGDYAPHSVLEGASLVASTNKNVHFLLYGDEKIISPIVNLLPNLNKISTIIHTDKIVSSDDKPSSALRNGKGSSMWMAIESVKEKKSDATVSAGNTGALMAIAKIILRTLPNIQRPAIAGILPNLNGKAVMLDLGANAECSPEILCQFAIMGDAFAKIILHKENPTIGLLNIGSEDVKGNETVKNACSLIKETPVPLNFIGFVEGNDIVGDGSCDVIVTDGFSGNIALKTAEGTAHLCKQFMKAAFKSSLLSKLGFLLASSALKKLANKVDPRLYNGALFLGLNGIVVKSHGGTDAVGFANAISVAIELASNQINDKITQSISSLEDILAV